MCIVNAYLFRLLPFRVSMYACLSVPDEIAICLAVLLAVGNYFFMIAIGGGLLHRRLGSAWSSKLEWTYIGQIENRILFFLWIRRYRRTGVEYAPHKCTWTSKTVIHTSPAAAGKLSIKLNFNNYLRAHASQKQSCEMQRGEIAKWLLLLSFGGKL